MTEPARAARDAAAARLRTAGSAEPLEILPGLRVAVAGVNRLLALKLHSRDERTRPQHQVDLERLIADRI